LEGDVVRRVLEALEFAAARHRDQRRKGADASPYINHLIRVTRLLADAGCGADGTLLCAAALHDTIEDTETTAAELERRFGAEVRAIVEEVTDDKRLPKETRKRRQIEHAPHLSHRARQVKIADKIANVEDIVAAPPKGWSLERRRAYIDWGEAVVAGCRGSNAALEARWDGTYVAALRRLAQESEETGPARPATNDG
jgi:guanosine-3',5'-bis(diphosphate) 3'-pyrophosphohydrolase